MKKGDEYCRFQLGLHVSNQGLQRLHAASDNHIKCILTLYVLTFE